MTPENKKAIASAVWLEDAYNERIPAAQHIRRLVAEVEALKSNDALTVAYMAGLEKAKSKPLTDEQIIGLAKKTETAEPGFYGYILPISFARAIEKAHDIGAKT